MLSLAVGKAHESYFVFRVLFLLGLEVLKYSLLLIILVFIELGYLGVLFLLEKILTKAYIKVLL